LTEATEIPKEVEETLAEFLAEETKSKWLTFCIEPNKAKKLDAICLLNRLSRSAVLRYLVELFLNDYDFQEKVTKVSTHG